jgi:hypothetical protein
MAISLIFTMLTAILARPTPCRPIVGSPNNGLYGPFSLCLMNRGADDFGLVGTRRALSQTATKSRFIIESPATGSLSSTKVS